MHLSWETKKLNWALPAFGRIIKIMITITKMSINYLTNDVTEPCTNTMTTSLIRRVREIKGEEGYKAASYTIMKLCNLWCWIIQQFVLKPTTQLLFPFHHSFWQLKELSTLILLSFFKKKNPEITIFTQQEKQAHIIIHKIHFYDLCTWSSAMTKTAFYTAQSRERQRSGGSEAGRCALLDFPDTV